MMWNDPLLNPLLRDQRFMLSDRRYSPSPRQTPKQALLI